MYVFQVPAEPASVSEGFSDAASEYTFSEPPNVAYPISLA